MQTETYENKDISIINNLNIKPKRKINILQYLYEPVKTEIYCSVCKGYQIQESEELKKILVLIDDKYEIWINVSDIMNNNGIKQIGNLFRI